jgi:hypothetical protein
MQHGASMDSPTAASARAADLRLRPGSGHSPAARGGNACHFKDVRISQFSVVNRASASCDGLERCNGVRLRGGRRRRTVASREVADPLRKVLDSIPLMPGQQSFRRPACPRFKVSTAGPDSTIESSSHTASSATSRRSCSTLGADCRCALLRVERATWFSLSRSYNSASRRQIVARNAYVVLQIAAHLYQSAPNARRRIPVAMRP